MVRDRGYARDCQAVSGLSSSQNQSFLTFILRLFQLEPSIWQLKVAKLADWKGDILASIQFLLDTIRTVISLIILLYLFLSHLKKSTHFLRMLQYLRCGKYLGSIQQVSNSQPLDNTSKKNVAPNKTHLIRSFFLAIALWP